MIATTLPASALTAAASVMVPGRIGPRSDHGNSAPSTSAPTNWKRLRASRERVCRPRCEGWVVMVFIAL